MTTTCNAKVYSDVIRTHELAFQALQEERKAKEALIAIQEALLVKYEGQINQLMGIVEQQRPFQQTFYLQNAQFAGGFINAETVQSHQIGGDIYKKDK